MKTAFKKGDIIEFEDGEYSDHSVWKPMRVVKNFNLKGLAKTYFSANPESHEPYYFNPDTFVGWLNAEGYIEDCEPDFSYRVWLGSYGIFNERLLK